MVENLAVMLHSRFCLLGRIEDLDEAITWGREHLARYPRGHRKRLTALQSLLTFIQERCRTRGSPADINEVIQLHREALKLRPASHHDHADSLSDLATGLILRFEQQGSVEDINDAVDLYRQALALRPAPHPYRDSSLNKLGGAMHMRFEQQGAIADIEEAVSLHREALALRLVPHPDRADSLNNLGNALCMRFGHRGVTADIHEAVKLLREALALLPELHPNHASCLNNLSIAISRCFDEQLEGAAEDIDEAVHLGRKALALRPAPHPNHSLMRRFGQRGFANDLNEAVLLNRQALALCSAPHPARGGCLGGLANSLFSRFQQRGASEDLDEAVSLHREAHPDRATSLKNLANSLSQRFEQRGLATDLDEAVLLNRQALALCPAPHPARGSSLGSLGNSIHRRFQQRGTAKDIDEAISLLREAVALHPPRHSDRGSSLINLAIAIGTRFQQRGCPDDLDEAIRINHEALANCPATDPRRGGCLVNLANSIYTRFEQRGNAKDIDDTVALHREALALRSILATSLGTRFEHRGASGDIDEAIHLHHEALALHPAPHLDLAISKRFGRQGAVEDLDKAVCLHREALTLHSATQPARATSLKNLATALCTRYEHRATGEDIDEAISLHREALALLPELNPKRDNYLHSLANAGAADDINESIHLNRQALALRPSPHPERANSLSSLATGIRLRFQQRGLASDIDYAAFSKASVAASASPLTQFNLAKIWARRAHQNHHISALPAYQRAIELLPQVAALSLDLQSRQKVLSSWSDNLGSDAATCAINLGKHELAMEFLEAGRSLLWSQSLHLRTSLDDLGELRPELATKLAELSSKLERSSFRHTSRNFQSDNQYQVMSTEEEGLKCRDLNNEWIQTVDEVRLLPGFENFLRPKSISQLRLAATRGPVVVLTAGTWACHALVLHPSGNVECIPLPEMGPRAVVKFLAEMVQAIVSDKFSSFLDTFAKRGSDSEEETRLVGRIVYEKKQNPDDCFYAVLGTLWRAIVVPVIQESSLKFQKSGSPSRVWWCPTGPFAFLPIHAAGVYGDQTVIHCVADYVVSSYTPTLTALLSPSHPPFCPDRPPKATAVAQPITEKFSPLPGTTVELSKIQERIPEKWRTDTIFDSPASVETVLQHLHTSSIMHFACHGVQNTEQPLLSALLLAGELLTVSQIMQRSGVFKNNSAPKDMGLAFLSACQTAAGDSNLPDEALHLAATLLFAGYRSVVATMWTMTDSDGPKVAEEFYGHLFRNANPNLNPPTPLHLAVKKLRDANVPLLRWIPFVHHGV
ncbi:tetratricopeptide repeat-containing protein [Mycena crocata]|nr:tetratricopeptide repeat-containing protein [Mycena crocata]